MFFYFQIKSQYKLRQNSLLGIQPIHCEHSENQQQATWWPGRLHIAGLVPNFFTQNMEIIGTQIYVSVTD